jgi:serine/threonine-protein kinase
VHETGREEASPADELAIDVEIEEQSEAPPERGGIVGAYQLLKRIAAGAVGEVYLGRSVNPTRVDDTVAVKLLSKTAAADPKQIELCLAEAYLLSMLGHPNVIRTFESGMCDDQLYLVMDYIDGPDLESLLIFLRRQKLRLPVPLVCDIFHQLLLALEYVHNATDSQHKPLHLVHRDVCPSNVFLARDGKVLLGDFGISLHGERKRRGKIIPAGHLGYMAPEQFTSKEIDQRSDVLGLGAILYKLFTHRAPFAEGNVEQCLAETREGTPPWPTELEPAVADALMALMKRALAPKPQARFQSIAEFSDAFTAAFGPAPRFARPILAALVRHGAGAEALPPRPSETSSGVSEAILLLSDADRDQVYTELLDKAGYKALPAVSTDMLSRTTALPVIVDLTATKPADLDRINDLQLPILVALGGPLTQRNLDKVAQLPCQWVDFAPYQAPALRSGLAACVLGRINALKPLPEATAAPKHIAGRRILLVGLPQTLGEEIRRRFAPLGVEVEARRTPQLARSLELERSYHLVVQAALSIDNQSLREATVFRRQLGYELVPFLIWLDGLDQTLGLFDRLPDAVNYVHRSITPVALCERIQQVLASYSQRAFARIPARLAVRYAYRGVAESGELTNISRLGALMHCGQMLHQGDRLGLSLRDHQGQVLELEAVVAHLRLDHEAARAGSFFVGLDLAGIAGAQERRWLQLLATVPSAPRAR